MSRRAVSITLDASERSLLQKISRQLTVPEYTKQRVRTVLGAAAGLQTEILQAA